MFGRQRSLSIRLIILSTMFSAIACAPPYDDQTDKQISTLGQDIDMEIATLQDLSDQIAELSKKSDAVSQKTLADLKAKMSYA
jgi:hypothetical protein